MALDIEAIKRKVAELNGDRGQEITYWFPEKGEHRVRALPWKTGVGDGTPILERYFYKIGTNKRALAPYQFGLPDPLNDFVISLYKKKTEEDKALAKKIRAKMTGYLPVVVRGDGKEDSVKVYQFTSFLYKRILGFWLDDEVGDITDPVNGFDLKFTLSHNGKFYNAKEQLDTVIDAARKSTPLCTDPEKAQKLLDSVPDLDGYFKKYNTKTAAELEAQLDAWLKSGDEVAAEEAFDGTAKGKDTASQDLDKLADDISAKAPKKEKAKSVDVDEVVEKPAKSKSTNKSLDDAFAELEKED